MKVRFTKAMLLLVYAMSVHSSVAMARDNIREFISGSYDSILHARHNRAFILVFWSIDCPPCYKELEQLGRTLTRELKSNLVLVSLDSVDDRDVIRDVLSKYNLSDVEAWLITGNRLLLRYQVDPAWRGELPRTYLFDDQHNRQSISGVLSPKQIKFE